MPCDNGTANSAISNAKLVIKPNGTTVSKKPTTKKTNPPLLRAEKKELQQNNFY